MGSSPTQTYPYPEGEPAPRRRRRLVWLGSGVAVVVGVVVAVLAYPSEVETVETPRAGGAPGFRLTDVRDPEREVALSEFRGRPVVLNFWASWCAPCRTEMPALQAVHEAVGDEVVFLGVNNSDARGPALDLLEETGVTFPSGFDPDGNVFRQYESIGMPTTVFISRDGRILGRHTGEITRDDLEDALRRFFGVEAAQGARR